MKPLKAQQQWIENTLLTAVSLYCATHLPSLEYHQSIGDNTSPINIENMGFNKTQVNTYIERYSQQVDEKSPEALNEQHSETRFQSCSRIEGIAHIPLCLNLICKVAEHSNEESLDQISGLSDLYQQLIVHILKHQRQAENQRSLCRESYTEKAPSKTFIRLLCSIGTSSNEGKKQPLNSQKPFAMTLLMTVFADITDKKQREQWKDEVLRCTQSFYRVQRRENFLFSPPHIPRILGSLVDVVHNLKRSSYLSRNRRVHTPTSL